MEVHLTADQKAFIKRGVQAGRYRNVEEAVQDALARWEEDERTRLELVAALREAQADLDEGRYMDYTDAVLPKLAQELKREGRARSRNRP